MADKKMLFCMVLGGLVLSTAQGLLCECSDDRAQIIPCFPNGTCATGEGGVCYTRIHSHDRYLLGCLNQELSRNGQPEIGVDPLICRNTRRKQYDFITKCCKDEDRCNIALVPTLGTPIPESTTADAAGSGNKAIVIAATIGGSALIICAVGLAICLYCIRKGRDNPSFEVDPESDPMITGSTTAATSLNELIEEFSCSGSGSGLPLLIQRTIARQIELHELVGKGRFGDVIRGTWRGDNVAVKMFHSREEQSWFREAEVYQTAMLRHENVLGFIAADNKDGGKWTQLWLITDYHEQGSLFDYLNTNYVDISTMFRLIHSTVCGIAHLHMEIIGSDMQDPNKQTAPGGSQCPRKPAIAHRDLKSKNILVKRNGVCCIADLGLAVKHDSEKNLIDMPKMNHRVGTIRYMPPEVLDETIQPQHFESYKQGDIYSLGLVIWEIASRLNINGHPEEYMLPYAEQAPSDPTVEEMRAVVVLDKLRPNLPNRWSNISALKLLMKLMKECWHEKPGARLTALRVKKTVSAMAETEGIIV